jgi:Tol biopolymer transport system component
VAPPAASAAASSAAASGRIAFMRTGPNAGVYVIDPDGKNERLVRPAAQVPRWSPDGSFLTFVEVGADDTVSLVVMKPDGSGRRVIHPDPTLNLGVGVWSPDGVWLAVEGWDDAKPSRTGVWIMRATDGSGLRQLTTGGHAIPGGFSPDGKEIAFVKLGDGESGTPEIVDVATGKARVVGRLTVGLYAGFMPDGSLFATSDGRIVILDRSGNQLGTVEAPEPHIAEAGVAKDGGHFVFAYDPEAAAAPGIYRTNLDGSDFQKVVHTNIGGVEEVAPDWGP